MYLAWTKLSNFIIGATRGLFRYNLKIQRIEDAVNIKGNL